MIMATMTFDRKELEQFIGKSRPLEEIVDSFEMLGMPVDKATEDEIVADITTDRVDMFTVEGAGRAIGQFLGISGPRKYKAEASKVVMNVDNVPARPIVLAFIAKGVKLDEKMIRSLIMAQEKLHETFGRKRKKIAIGIHDLDKVSPPISYRAFKYVTFVPLDTDKEMSPADILKEHPKGKEYAHIFDGVTEYPMVMDTKGVLSFPPIINSERTRLTDKTKNLLVDITGTSESAVRSTAHILATALYDRGASIENIKLKMMQGGEQNSLIFERKEKLSLKFANKTLGLRLKPERAIELLAKMGYAATAEEGKGAKSDTITIEVPPYRADIIHEVDFVEDIAVAYGYENFKPDLPKLMTIGSLKPETQTENNIRGMLVSSQFNEINSWTLTNEETDRKALINDSGVEIKNPRTNDFTRFRTDLLPSLLSALAINKTRGLPQRLFEIGRVADAKGNCSTHLCCVITAERASFSDIAGVFDVVKSSLNATAEPADAGKEFLIPGRSVRFIRESGKIEGKKREADGTVGSIGWCGEIHPQALENFKIDYPVAAFEILLPTVVPAKAKRASRRKAK
ncbi:Phenylalanine--tRNA ligase beta subunit [uncultured archaeon]|nr:Phenylalanine--tRNA ligase beta subunit [uncultured archaeon]